MFNFHPQILAEKVIKLAEMHAKSVIGGCHMHDDVKLLSSDSTGKGDKASRNACKVCKGCNASTNLIPIEWNRIG